MDDGGAGGMNRDMTSGGGRGGYSGRGGYHQGYSGRGGHGAGGMLGRGGEVGQGEHLAHGGPPAVFKPAPEFEMKGNDFPALPGLDEPRKVSESSDGGSKPWESEKRYHIQYHMEKRLFYIFQFFLLQKINLWAGSCASELGLKVFCRLKVNWKDFLQIFFCNSLYL